MSQFQKDLELGQKIEERLFNLLSKIFKVERSNGYCKEWDMKIGDIKIELKYDKKSNDTPNYFIEAFFNNKKSGIMATDADIWVQYDGDVFRCISTDKLKEIVKNFPLLTKKIYENVMRFYLIPKNIIKSESLIISDYDI